jgi:hypothetical protein
MSNPQMDRYCSHISKSRGSIFGTNKSAEHWITDASATPHYRLPPKEYSDVQIDEDNRHFVLTELASRQLRPSHLHQPRATVEPTVPSMYQLAEATEMRPYATPPVGHGAPKLDYLHGSRSSKDFRPNAVGLRPNKQSGDELAFLKMHRGERFDDRSGNPSSVYQGSTKPINRYANRMGYNPEGMPDDAESHEFVADKVAERQKDIRRYLAQRHLERFYPELFEEEQKINKVSLRHATQSAQNQADAKQETHFVYGYHHPQSNQTHFSTISQSDYNSNIDRHQFKDLHSVVNHQKKRNNNNVGNTI